MNDFLPSIALASPRPTRQGMTGHHHFGIVPVGAGPRPRIKTQRKEAGGKPPPTLTHPRRRPNGPPCVRRKKYF